MYFAAPMFFRNEYIDFLAEQNSRDTRYKIRRVFNSLNYWSKFNSGFEYGKAVNGYTDGVLIDTAEELEGYVKRLEKENIEFVYLMNLASTITPEKFYKMSPNLDMFINRLIEMGVKYITVANQMLADYIKCNFPEIVIGASTMMHVDSIGKAKGVVEQLGIKYIVPATDVNKDFDFIKTFKKVIPNVELEIMANEGCIFNCPTKNYHYSVTGFVKEDEGIFLPGRFQLFPTCVCGDICDSDVFLELTKDKIVYPWELQKYEEFGVDGIKLVGRNQEYNITCSQIETYMIGSTDPEKIMEKTLHDITVYFPRKSIGFIQLKELKPYLPELDYFLDKRPNCRSICGDKCKYCYVLAEKLKKKFPDVCGPFR